MVFCSASFRPTNCLPSAHLQMARSTTHTARSSLRASAGMLSLPLACEREQEFVGGNGRLGYLPPCGVHGKDRAQDDPRAWVEGARWCFSLGRRCSFASAAACCPPPCAPCLCSVQHANLFLVTLAYAFTASLSLQARRARGSGVHAAVPNTADGWSCSTVLRCGSWVCLRCLCSSQCTVARLIQFHPSLTARRR